MSTSSTLLTIIDPTQTEQPALKLAEQLAVDTGAHIYAFCCTYVDDINAYASRKDAKHQTLINTKERLNELISPLRNEGLNVTAEAFWNQDWQQSVIHACGRQGADMMIKTLSPHTPIARQLTKTSDYNLLRNAPCPVLLTRTGAPWSNRRILAAIDIESNSADHDLLNNVVVTAAQKLAKSTGFELYLVTALDATTDTNNIMRLLNEDDIAQTAENVIAERFGVNASRIIIQRGRARQVIADTANDVNADVLVIGTVARKGLGAIILGNTSEKLIDELPIDILVVN